MPQQLRFRRGTDANKISNPLLYGEPYFNADDDIRTVQIGTDTSDITLVAFPYSGSGVITGSLELTGNFTASLQSGYTWVGGAGNITTLVATSSFGVGPGGGHEILDSGSGLTQRSKLDFVRFTLTDDLPNDKTIVTRPPSTTVASSPPTDPLEGDEFIDNATWKKYIWYLNGAGTDYWVETGIATPTETGSISIDGFPYTGHAIITGDLTVSNAITASIVTSSLFIGNGAGLINISASSIVGLNLARIATGSISASVDVNGSTFSLDSGSTNIINVSGSNNNIGFGGVVNPLETVHITGSLLATNALTASYALISGSGNNQLIIRGSGSSNPLFSIVGSQGQLFSITDELSGSLFSANNISGFPVLEAFSDDTVLMGAFSAPGLYTSAKKITTVGSNVFYSLLTASYDSAFFDYKISSGSNARAGQITALVHEATILHTEITTIDIGNTSEFNFTVIITGSYMALTGSAASNAWTVKTIVRAI